MLQHITVRLRLCCCGVGCERVTAFAVVRVRELAAARVVRRRTEMGPTRDTTGGAVKAAAAEWSESMVSIGAADDKLLRA